MTILQGIYEQFQDVSGEIVIHQKAPKGIT